MKISTYWLKEPKPVAAVARDLGMSPRKLEQLCRAVRTYAVGRDGSFLVTPASIDAIRGARLTESRRSVRSAKEGHNMSAPSLSTLSKRLDALEAENRELRKLAKRQAASAPNASTRPATIKTSTEAILAFGRGELSAEQLLDMDSTRRSMKVVPFLTDAQRDKLRGNEPPPNVQRFSIAEAVRKRTYGGAA